MRECTGSHYFINGSLSESSGFNPSLVYEGESLYEVIRISGSVPLFFEDHMLRLQSSAGIRKREMLATGTEISGLVRKLIAANGLTSGNIKIVFNYNCGGRTFLIYFIETQYPDREMYVNGVDTILFHAERSEPGAKVFNQHLRSSIYQHLIRKGAYEALLVNNSGCITEGSRSNLFFVKDGGLITAPDNVVLAGITRQHIISISSDEGLKTDFRSLNISELPVIDAIFISGTSPHILPVRSVENFTFNVNDPVISLLSGKFRSLVNKYIEENGYNGSFT